MFIFVCSWTSIPIKIVYNTVVKEICKEKYISRRYTDLTVQIWGLVFAPLRWLFITMTDFSPSFLSSFLGMCEARLSFSLPTPPTPHAQFLMPSLPSPPPPSRFESLCDVSHDGLPPTTESYPRAVATDALAHKSSHCSAIFLLYPSPPSEPSSYPPSKNMNLTQWNQRRK